MVVPVQLVGQISFYEERKMTVHGMLQWAYLQRSALASDRRRMPGRHFLAAALFPHDLDTIRRWRECDKDVGQGEQVNK